MDEVFHIILGSVIPAVGGYIWGKYKRYQEEQNREKQEYKLIKQGLQSLLRDRMLQAYYCHKEKGYASSADKGAFEAMHTAYAGLGKNGVMDTIYTEFMVLPDEMV